MQEQSRTHKEMAVRSTNTCKLYSHPDAFPVDELNKDIIFGTVTANENARDKARDGNHNCPGYHHVPSLPVQ